MSKTWLLTKARCRVSDSCKSGELLETPRDGQPAVKADMAGIPVFPRDRQGSETRAQAKAVMAPRAPDISSGNFRR